MQLPGRRASLIVAAALVCGVVAAMVLLGRPAATLSAATPAYGATMDRAPATISLTFTTALAQAHLDVSGAVAGGPPLIEGSTVTLPVTINAAGRYVVAYHVVTADGGEVSGTLPFTVGTGPATEPLAEPSAHHHGELDPLTTAMIAVNLLVVLVLGVLLIRGRGRAPR
jgi:copper resistance protein C